MDIKIKKKALFVINLFLANFSHSKDLNQAKRMRDDLMLKFMNLQAAKN